MKNIFLIAVLIICAANLYAQVNLDSGLVASYPFQGNANDVSGNGNDGVVLGAIPTTDRFGIDSAAYEFDGSSGYISIESSPSLESPDSELTQCAWIYIHSWSLVGASFGPITMKTNVYSNSFQYRLSVSSEGINTAINSWNNSVTTPDTLDFDEWYFILTTLKNDTVKTYVNGEYIGEGTLIGPINYDNHPLEIGRDTPGAPEFFHGKLDDLRIYNRVLSQEEITSLYNPSPSAIDYNKSYMPDKFILEQNYPNPFNPATNLSFVIGQLSFVSLKVYDVLGNEVALLVNEEKPAGKYLVKWNATAVPSGVYLYQLKAATVGGQIRNFTETRKMILLK